MRNHTNKHYENKYIQIYPKKKKMIQTHKLLLINQTTFTSFLIFIIS